MIKQINPLPFVNEWCEICKKKCDKNERFPYLISSTNNVKSIVICKACMDLALNEQNILPEDF